VPDIAVGEYTIVHVGFALSKIDETEALRTLALFEQLGVLQEELADGDEAFARAASGPQSDHPKPSRPVEPLTKVN
jgi:hydrogenase expression/formation protein HypC